MCEPTTLAIMTIASSAMQAFGAIQAGNAQAAASAYQAHILDQNRATALDNARRQQLAADQEENALRRKNAQMLGSQIAAAGASGIELSSGSINDVFGDTVTLGEEDALTLRSNWNDRIRGLYSDAQGYAQQAALSRAEGKQARTAGYINAASSLLASAGKIGDAWGTLTAKPAGNTPNSVTIGSSNSAWGSSSGSFPSRLSVPGGFSRT